MLLNPNDYEYEYFQQPRGTEGDSGVICMGRPKVRGASAILVKSLYTSDAINEYIGCNLGHKLGINTARAWLFRQDIEPKFEYIDFTCAVGIEYLDGLKELRELPDFQISSIDDEELIVQCVEGRLLHILLGEEDGESLAMCKGKIYAIDFAMGLYPNEVGKSIPPIAKEIECDDGFTLYNHVVLDREDFIRKQLKEMRGMLQNIGISDELFVNTYMDLRERFMQAYNEKSLSDLTDEIREAFSEDAADYATDLLGAMQQAFVSPL